MAFTPIVIGSLAWGTPVNNAFTSQDARITVSERQGILGAEAMDFVAMNYDTSVITAGRAGISGTVYLTRVDLPVAATITASPTAIITTVGAGLTAGQNFAGLYDAAGNRVAVTADQSANWTTTGEKIHTFTAPYTAAAGTYYVALLANGTTPPGFAGSAGSASVATLVNHGLSNATLRWSSGPTGQTSLPATITMSARVASGLVFFAGLA